MPDARGPARCKLDVMWKKLGAGVLEGEFSMGGRSNLTRRKGGRPQNTQNLCFRREGFRSEGRLQKIQKKRRRPVRGAKPRHLDEGESPI